ncbi:MAG: protein-disulfide reductase DsbD family protein, partial [Verrucomicrobiota bacterium]
MSLPAFHFRFLLVTIWAFTLVGADSGMAQFGAKHVKAELIVAHEAVVPGQEFVVGVKLTIDPNWHTYWINPGGPGLPTSAKWDLPQGFAAGELQFPYPHQFETAGLLGFGYENQVIHLVTIKVADDVKPGQSVTLKTKVRWLMCDPQTCMPDSADLSITVKVAAELGAETPQATEVAAAGKTIPKVPEGWQSGFQEKDGKIVITMAVGEVFTSFPDDLAIYPETKKVIKLGEKPAFELKDGLLTMTLSADPAKADPLPTVFRAVLHSDQGIGEHSSVLIVAK